MPEGDARSLAQDAQEALRVRGVRMLVEQGMTQLEVADCLGVSERAVRAWARRHRRGGWEALAKRPRGRDSASQMLLSAGQQARLVQAIKSQSPDQLRIPGLLWTRGAVRDLIERDCGVRLDLSTVGRYLRRWGFTLKRPVKRALEADPVVVEAWLEDVYPKIKARAAKQNGLILWQDESGVRLQQLTPKAGYAPRGTRAVATISAKRIGLNMISALANSGQLHFSIFEGKFTAKLFIAFLARLIGHYPDRKIFLICDNHSTHHAKLVKAWVAQRAERIELIFLPAYSPELNPDEYLNQDVKRHMREVYPRPVDKPGLKATVRSFLRRRQRQPQIVRNYFGAPHVQYAAA
ncbi:MAG: IS630 family transposase [Actinobacteria bacterium]|nr:IS630 family transposase [Actinomycetota bacterium]